MQTESLSASTIKFPMPPDFSCEIQKPLRYVDYIAGVIGSKARDKGAGVITLSIEEVETFCWMLREAGTVIYQMDEAFFGKDGWSHIWWKNRASLESSGIEVPHWFEIENNKTVKEVTPCPKSNVNVK